jgi:hypothetical protein
MSESPIRSWRSGSAATPRPPVAETALREKLLRLASRVAPLSISIRNPWRFDVERAEIVDQLRRVVWHTQGGADASSS